MSVRAGSKEMALVWRRTAGWGRRLDPVLQPHDSRLFRAVHAAEVCARLLHAMPYDLAAAMRAVRCELVYRALERIERIGSTGGSHRESLVVIVAANITFGHRCSLSALPFGLLLRRGDRNLRTPHASRDQLADAAGFDVIRHQHRERRPRKADRQECRSREIVERFHVTPPLGRAKALVVSADDRIRLSHQLDQADLTPGNDGVSFRHRVEPRAFVLARGEGHECAYRPHAVRVAAADAESCQPDRPAVLQDARGRAVLLRGQRAVAQLHMSEQLENILDEPHRFFLHTVALERMIEKMYEVLRAKVGHQLVDAPLGPAEVLVNRLVDFEDVDMDPLPGFGEI